MVRPIGGMKSFGSINMSQKENKAASEADATKKIKQECTTTISKAGKSPYQQMMEQAKSKQESIPGPKQLIDKPIDKFASKTSYGMNPLELAKKFDKEQKDEEVEKKVENSSKYSFGSFQSKSIQKVEQERQILEAPKIKEQEQHKNPFQSLGGNKSSSPFASKPKEDFSSKPSLSAAVFGKSSLNIEADDQEKQNKNDIKVERTFGSVKHGASSGFKSLFGAGQPSQNTFLANKGNKADNNDMDEEDLNF